MEMQVTARRKMGKGFCLLDHKWKTVNIHWFNNVICRGMLTNWWFLKMVWIWLSNVSWSECLSHHTIQGWGFRGDMTLRHDLCFSIESRRGDRKMGQTTGKPVSCPEELPAAGVHGKMEKKMDVWSQCSQVHFVIFSSYKFKELMSQKPLPYLSV